MIWKRKLTARRHIFLVHEGETRSCERILSALATGDQQISFPSSAEGKWYSLGFGATGLLPHSQRLTAG
jgi:hypothetical protein